ncbi:MAG: hypothetical protein AB1633_12570, partial [Elusimicrobiota bacterium]
AGADFIFDKSDSSNNTFSKEIKDFGGHISFGVEKSMGWEWFLVRVGGSKSLLARTINDNGKDYRMRVENPDIDGSLTDLIGFGIGLCFQKRLRFDLLINEALPYFNPFGKGLEKSNNGNHMFLKISSTFSL